MSSQICFGVECDRTIRCSFAVALHVFASHVGSPRAHACAWCERRRSLKHAAPAAQQRLQLGAQDDVNAQEMFERVARSHGSTWTSEWNTASFIRNEYADLDVPAPAFDVGSQQATAPETDTTSDNGATASASTLSQHKTKEGRLKIEADEEDDADDVYQSTC